MRNPPTVPVVLAGAAAFLNLYATQPLLPLLARVFHASAFQVGLTVTAPTVAVAIAAPFVGRLADVVGLRRVIVGSAFLLAVATMLASTSATLTQLIAWRFVQGIVTPGIFAGTVAYIHEMWPAEQSGRATAAYMTGTILGGFFGRASTGLIGSYGDWHWSFAFIGVCILVTATVMWRTLPDERDGRPEGLRYNRHSHSRVGALLRNRALVATYAIGFCVLFTNVAVFTYITFYLAAPPFGLSTAALGWLFVVYLVGAAVTPFGGRWIDAYGHRTGMTVAMTIGAVGALLTLSPSLPVIIAGLALASTGVFIAQTTTSSHIGSVTNNDRALAVGLYSTCYYSGGSAGGSAPASVWNAAGWPGCVALVVIVQLAGAVIALTLWAPRQNRATDEVRRPPSPRLPTDGV
ncbi:MAG TPA: MFS transporter [Vicinamibacterales bacterium]|nr:MFS transporter [Vicinamibacterales bacterium]